VNASLRQLTAWLGVLALLAGCASGGGLVPQAKLGDASKLSARAALASAPLSPAAWPARDWWKRYGDGQLDALIAEAFAGNPSLRVADARVRQAAAFAGLAEAAQAPQMGAAAGSSRQRYSANSALPPLLAGNWAWSNAASLNFSYELDFWGKNQAAFDAAMDRQHASEVEAEASRLMLAVGITQTYLRLSQTYAQLDLAQAELRQREQLLALTGERVRAQIDSAVELKQAELAIPVAREQIAAIRETLAHIGSQLAALLGAGPDRGATIGRPHLAGVRPAAIPASLPSELIARRPDVVAQRWRVEALREDILVAKTQFYPSVNLGALIGLQSLGFDNLFKSASRVSGASSVLSLPIFDGGRLRSNLALRDAEYDIAVEQYNLTLVDAVRDVVDQLISIEWLGQRVALQADALTTAQQAHALSVQRFRSGLGNYLQVLVTELQVLSQQRAQIELEARAFDLDINLVRALGGGYHSIADAVSPAHASPVLR
jgi:NodT family efflux transporter outer membrane factor (OMF) lipoprotein